MIHHGTDWNRHRGVGETLLENWVEERAVGDLILEERSDLPHLSRAGHKNLIVDSKEPASFTTNHRDNFKVTPRLAKRMVGKRRQLLEEEILKKTLEEFKEPDEDRSAREWVSTTYSDFSQSDVYKPFRGLGQEVPSPEQSAKFRRPITFWTDYAVKGSGTAICSTDAVELQNRGRLNACDSTGKPIVGLRACQVYQDHASAAAVRFGRHPAFTTPIKESLTDFHKEPK